MSQLYIDFQVSVIVHTFVDLYVIFLCSTDMAFTCQYY